MATLSAHDHLRPVDADYPAGIYRVVGVGGESVRLLRVADADGRRVHTGEVVAVGPDELDGFEPAGNPDAGVPGFGAALSAAYWSARAFAGELAAHPAATAVALALVAVGTVADRVPALPEAASVLAVLVGGLGLAYVGSGRLSGR